MKQKIFISEKLYIEKNRKDAIKNLIEKKEKPSSGFLKDNSEDADFTFFLKSKQTRKIETSNERWTVDRAESKYQKRINVI